jgi:hypothetical protein
LFVVQLPATVAHERPVPQVVTPQHTPSVQKRPVPQPLAPLHALPMPTFGVHAPLLQKSLAMHWLSSVHDVKHAVGPHVYLSHDLGTSLQLPEPSHALTWCSTPALHEAAPHDVAPPG